MMYMTRRQLTRLRRMIPRVEQYRAKLLDAQKLVGNQLAKVVRQYRSREICGWPPRLGTPQPSSKVEAHYQALLKQYVSLDRALKAFRKLSNLLYTFSGYYSDREREVYAERIEKRMAQTEEWCNRAKKLLRKVKR